MGAQVPIEQVPIPAHAEPSQRGTLASGVIRENQPSVAADNFDPAGNQAANPSGSVSTITTTRGAPEVDREDGDEPEEGLTLSPACSRLPVNMAVAVPVREFRVRHLLAIAPGAVIETRWGHGEDLPLASADVQLAWTEFEIVDAKLAVRVTRLA